MKQAMCLEQRFPYFLHRGAFFRREIRRGALSSHLTLNLLTTTIVAPPINASKWQMGFNSAFKGCMKNEQVHQLFFQFINALSPLLFNFALEYAIRRVQVRQDGLKLKGMHQLLAYADDVNILGGSVHTVKENAEALAAATKETELEVNADKTKYIVMSREGNAGRGHSVKIDNSAIERLEEFKYLGVMLTDKNSIQEEIKSRLKLGNACYHSVQNLLSSRLLSKNLKIKIYRTIILPVVLYGCETWSLTLMEEHRLRVFEKRC